MVVAESEQDKPDRNKVVSFGYLKENEYEEKFREVTKDDVQRILRLQCGMCGHLIPYYDFHVNVKLVSNRKRDRRCKWCKREQDRRRKQLLADVKKAGETKQADEETSDLEPVESVPPAADKFNQYTQTFLPIPEWEISEAGSVEIADSEDKRKRLCTICEFNSVQDDDNPFAWCKRCMNYYPLSLLLATVTPSLYELCTIKNYQTFQFESAIIKGEWVRIKFIGLDKYVDIALKAIESCRNV
jgi:hypothetical protein